MKEINPQNFYLSGLEPRCERCGATGELHHHHPIPKVLSGLTSQDPNVEVLDGTVLLCPSCHRMADEEAQKLGKKLKEWFFHHPQEVKGMLPELRKAVQQNWCNCGSCKLLRSFFYEYDKASANFFTGDRFER